MNRENKIHPALVYFNKPAQPTAGAMRAALAIHDISANCTIEEGALIIDRETGIAELVAALEAMIETPYQNVVEQTESFSKARAVLAKL